MGAPYWRDYLARERTMCSLCYREGRGWVRIGPPIPPDLSHRGKSAFVNRQRPAMMNHWRAFHPTVPITWSRS